MKLPITASSGQSWIYLIYNDPLAYADLILNRKLNVLFE